MDEPNSEIKKITKLAELDIQGRWKNDFNLFHEINPKFFRSGVVSDYAKELDGELLDTFWMFHGDWMEVMSYGRGDMMMCGKNIVLRKTFHELYQSILPRIKPPEDDHGAQR